MKNFCLKSVMTGRKNILMSVLLVGYAALAINPVAAKPGDLYRNKDGSCNTGDKQRQGWCVESLAAGAPVQSGSTPSASMDGMWIFDRWGNKIKTKEGCKSAGGVWAGPDGKGSCTGPRK